MRFAAIISLLLFFSLEMIAQYHSTFSNKQSGLQYGASLKASVDLATKHNSAFRICLNGGIGSEWISPHIYPSLNMELQLYHGGLGSRWKPGRGLKWVTLDYITAFTITAGAKNNFTKSVAALQKRNNPLYYFADFTYPALQNPYNYSLSLGTNIIFSSDCKRERQRVGFFNMNFNHFQVSYFNDGGLGMADLYLGDRRDRYYTGGFVFSYRAYPSSFINLAEVSFKKFTGYNKNAFEVANLLNLAFIPYADSAQNDFNKSLWTVTIANTTKGYGFNYKNYNSKSIDVQHLIHRFLYNSFHTVPYKKHASVGIDYYNIHNHINRR